MTRLVPWAVTWMLVPGCSSLGSGPAGGAVKLKRSESVPKISSR